MKEFYRLTEDQINEIIKEGNFNKDKNTENLLIYHITTKDLTEIPYEIEKVTKDLPLNEVYKRIFNNISVCDKTDENIINELLESFYELFK